MTERTKPPCLHCAINELIAADIVDKDGGHATGSNLRDAIGDIARSLGEAISLQPVAELKRDLYSLAMSHIQHAINLAAARDAEMAQAIANQAAGKPEGLKGTPAQNAPGSNLKN